MKYDLLIEERKIIVFAQIKGINDISSFKFILDTGASKSVVDYSVATILGYDLRQLDNGDRLTTASGKIHSKILKLPKFSLFGKDLVNFEVSVIKFPLQITLISDGLLGMDFLLQFKNLKFDFEKQTIET